MKDILNLELINSKKIARELYDSNNIGVIIIPKILSEDFRREALLELKLKSNLFHDAPRIEGTTLQELRIHYCGDADNKKKQKCPFDSISELRNQYSIAYSFLGKLAGFNQGENLNSIGVHWYPSGSIGMGIHRDYSNDINLISSFVLSGDTNFCAYQDKAGNGKIEFKADEGSLILMRGPRNEREIDMRPYHAVSAVNKERFSVLFRQKKVNGVAPINASK